MLFTQSENIPMTSSMNRRTFLLTAIAAAATLGQAGVSAAAELPKLPESDPTAKALGYVENAAKLDPAKEAAYQKGRTCAGCALYQKAQAQGGFAPCAAFPGKRVNATGWCRAFAAAPA
jgi:hypothetical protein